MQDDNHAFPVGDRAVMRCIGGGLAAVVASLIPSSPPTVSVLMLCLLAIVAAADLLDLWLTREPTVLYRLYAADGTLLYAGISRCLERRLRQHSQTKPWWPEVSRIKTVTYRTRARAARAEHAAIFREDPRHNVMRLALDAHLRSARAR